MDGTDAIIKWNTLYGEECATDPRCRFSWEQIHLYRAEVEEVKYSFKHWALPQTLTSLKGIEVGSWDEFVATMFDYSVAGYKVWVDYNYTYIDISFKPTDDHTSNITPELIESFAGIVAR